MEQKENGLNIIRHAATQYNHPGAFSAASALTYNGTPEDLEIARKACQEILKIPNHPATFAAACHLAKRSYPIYGTDDPIPNHPDAFMAACRNNKPYVVYDDTSPLTDSQRLGYDALLTIAETDKNRYAFVAATILCHSPDQAHKNKGRKVLFDIISTIDHEKYDQKWQFISDFYTNFEGEFPYGGFPYDVINYIDEKKIYPQKINVFISKLKKSPDSEDVKLGEDLYRVLLHPV
jgi:hypothetical protein